jgi:hypothetical protein
LAVKLQHHSLANTLALERNYALNRENTRLRAEIAILRAKPDPTPHPATLHTQELSLALRRVSDKLTLTESALLARTADLLHTRNDLSKAQHAVEDAYALAAAACAREKDTRIRERNLHNRIRAVEEDRKMSDYVVSEYANLVRGMEGRSPPASCAPVNGSRLSASTSTATLVDSLAEGKLGLQKLLEEFNTESSCLESELFRVHGQLSISETSLASECKNAAQDRAELAKALVELERLEIDDKTAAKMVSRYM